MTRQEQYYPVDMHTHTWYSDGRAAPAELVRAASQRGIQTLAITDHDNTRAAQEVRSLAAELGVELVPAIEFTCAWGKERPADVSPNDIDVLGYWIDLDSAAFQSFEAQAQADMSDRLDECCRLMTASGYAITLADLLDVNPRYAGFMQLFEVIQGVKHYVSGPQAAQKLFSSHWGRVRASGLCLDQVVEAIHAAGGVAVLAHPTVIRTANGWLRAGHLRKLVNLGLDGIEIYHPRLGSDARAYFLYQASRLGLAVSGGSDEHGWPQGFPRLGRQPVNMDIVASLRERRKI